MRTCFDRTGVSTALNPMQSMEIPSFPSAFVKEVLQGRADIALEQVEIAKPHSPLIARK